MSLRFAVNALPLVLGACGGVDRPSPELEAADDARQDKEARPDPSQARNVPVEAELFAVALFYASADSVIVRGRIVHPGPCASEALAYVKVGNGSTWEYELENYNSNEHEEEFSIASDLALWDGVVPAEVAFKVTIPACKFVWSGKIPVTRE